MEDLTLGIDEELELDYEAEDVANKESDKQQILINESSEENLITPRNDRIEQETKILSRKRRFSPEKWNKGIINEFNDVEPGRDLSEPKRFRYLPEFLPKNFFPDECDGDLPEDIVDDHPELTRTEVAKLFESLDIKNMDNDEVPLNSIYIKGTKDMTNYAIEKIFAEFNPHIALKVDDESFIVQFKTSRIAAKMFVAMTKKVKRVRKPKHIEDGEIADSDEEKEGQIKKDTEGENVELVNGIKNDTEGSDEVEIDVTSVKVPKGKWRVLTKHVNYGKILLTKYAHYKEIIKAKNNTDNILYRQQRVDALQNNSRVKPGINVFDSTGAELPWNFNHDTRIFNDPMLKDVIQEAEKVEEQQDKVVKVGDKVIQSRGRGARKITNLRFSSDEEESEESETEEEPKNNFFDPANPIPQKPSDVFKDSILK